MCYNIYKEDVIHMRAAASLLMLSNQPTSPVLLHTAWHHAGLGVLPGVTVRILTFVVIGIYIEMLIIRQPRHCSDSSIYQA